MQVNTMMQVFCSNISKVLVLEISITTRQQNEDKRLVDSSYYHIIPFSLYKNTNAIKLVNTTEMEWKVHSKIVKDKMQIMISVKKKPF